MFSKCLTINKNTLINILLPFFCASVKLSGTSNATCIRASDSQMITTSNVTRRCLTLSRFTLDFGILIVGSMLLAVGGISHFVLGKVFSIFPTLQMYFVQESSSERCYAYECQFNNYISLNFKELLSSHLHGSIVYKKKRT